MTKAVVIGAGVGGLTTAALLAKAGVEVTVLEAHVYPGGCAGTFFHQGYKFDAGATLAGGFYPDGPMDVIAKNVGIADWPTHRSDPAMTVSLPTGQTITRWIDEDKRIAERHAAFGKQSDAFWNWQESTADALWEFAMRFPAWPPQTARQVSGLAGHTLGWLGSQVMQRPLKLPGIGLDVLRPVASHLRNQSDALRLFIDAQLLIAAQTTSQYANALYGASALDLPRRGIVHLKGGIGAIAEVLAQAVRNNGGEVLYRQEVTGVSKTPDNKYIIETKRRKGLNTFDADFVVSNLPPWNIRKLLGDDTPPKLARLPEKPKDGWGAFMIYVGLDEGVLPTDFPLHHQVIAGEPLGEGNSIFLSLSPAWDKDRGPAGQRALTISTHTSLAKWWELLAADPAEYGRQKEMYTEMMLKLAERAIPNLREAAQLIKAGTPVTFKRFTRREWGWVGGFPQTNLFRAWGPKLMPNFWMVGDSIFPGQSTAAVALGGLRVARDILYEFGISEEVSDPTTVEQLA